MLSSILVQFGVTSRENFHSGLIIGFDRDLVLLEINNSETVSNWFPDVSEMNPRNARFVAINIATRALAHAQ